MNKIVLHTGVCFLFTLMTSHAQQIVDTNMMVDGSYYHQQQGNENISTQDLDVDPDRRAQAEALLKRISLRRDFKAGIISEEEYLRQKASLDEIIHSQIECSNDNAPGESSYLTDDLDLQARMNAFQKKLILRGRMEIRAITKEEYNREAAPLDGIIQYPGILTNGVNPEQVMSPDIRGQVDAFKKSIILQREYQRGLITSEEFSRQSDVLNGIMQRPVQWMTVE